MTPTEAKEDLRAWILKRGNLEPGAALGDKDALVGGGVINSLDVMELLDHIEALKGAPVDRMALTGAEFETLDAMAAAFFGAGL